MDVPGLAKRLGMPDKYRVLYAIEKRDTGKSQYTFKIAEVFGIPANVLSDGSDADIDAWLTARQAQAGDPAVIDVQAREVREQGVRHLPHGPSAPPSDALDAVRSDVQALPPELRDVLARLVTEYLTAANDRKDVLRAAIERLKGGQYQGGASGT